MNDTLNGAKTLAGAMRAPVILGIAVIGGTMIGAKYDAPVQGLAGGLVAAAFVNAVLDYQMIRNQVS